MTHLQILTLGLVGLACGLGACGGAPTLTETTTNSSLEQTDDGGEVRHSTTETREVYSDGSETTERTETTTTTHPSNEQ